MEEPPFKSIKQVQQFIKITTEDIQKRKNVQQIVSRIANQVINDHLAAIIAIHNTGLLVQLFDLCTQKCKDGKSELWEKIQIIFVYGYQCFFKKIPRYKRIFDIFKARCVFSLDKKYTDYTHKSIDRYQVLKKAAGDLFQLKELKKQPQEHIEQLNVVINKWLNKLEPTTPFEQCFMTWFKKELQQLQNSIYKNMSINDTFLCCRLHYMNNEQINGVNILNQDFISAKQKSSIDRNFFKGQFIKSIVAFLNTKGGVIYIGAAIDGKRSIITGISFKEEERIKLLSFLTTDVIFKILPYVQETSKPNEPFQKRHEKRVQALIATFQKSPKDVNYQYQINRYISIDLIPTYNRETCLYSRDPQVQYLMRIKVKPGDQYEVYHCINEKETPQATYQINNINEKEQSFDKFYEEVYRRLKLKAKANGEEKQKIRWQGHAFCRLSHQHMGNQS